MSTPWTPVLGDINSPSSESALGIETAARIAADNALQVAISSEANARILAVIAAIAACQAPIWSLTQRSIAIFCSGTSVTPFALGTTASISASFPTIIGPSFSGVAAFGLPGIVMTSTTTANAPSGISDTGRNQAVRGNLDNRGGFNFLFVFQPSALPAGSRMFIGLDSAPGTLTSDIDSRGPHHFIGIGRNAADTNWQLYSSNSVATTKVDLGIAPNTGHPYALTLTATPNSATIHIVLLDLFDGSILCSVDVTATLPGATTYMRATMYAGISSAGTASTMTFFGIVGTVNA